MRSRSTCIVAVLRVRVRLHVKLNSDVYNSLTFLKAVKDHNFTVNATVRKELCLHCGSLFQASMNDISIRTRSSRSKCGKKRTLLTSTQLTSSLTEKEKASCKSHHVRFLESVHSRVSDKLSTRPFDAACVCMKPAFLST